MSYQLLSINEIGCQCSQVELDLLKVSNEEVLVGA